MPMQRVADGGTEPQTDGLEAGHDTGSRTKQGHRLRSGARDSEQEAAKGKRVPAPSLSREVREDERATNGY